jgi:hypothetical protein
VRRAIADLHHDVGKRIARTARNVRDMPITEPVRAMLIKDLYAIDGHTRASVVFQERMRPLGAMHPLHALGPVLAAIDALECELRAGNTEAIRDALMLACEVSDAIREELVREADS